MTRSAVLALTVWRLLLLFLVISPSTVTVSVTGLSLTPDHVLDYIYISFRPAKSVGDKQKVAADIVASEEVALKANPFYKGLIYGVETAPIAPSSSYSASLRLSFAERSVEGARNTAGSLLDIWSVRVLDGIHRAGGTPSVVKTLVLTDTPTPTAVDDANPATTLLVADMIPFFTAVASSANQKHTKGEEVNEFALPPPLVTVYRGQSTAMCAVVDSLLTSTGYSILTGTSNGAADDVDTDIELVIDADEVAEEGSPMHASLQAQRRREERQGAWRCTVIGFHETMQPSEDVLLSDAMIRALGTVRAVSIDLLLDLIHWEEPVREERGAAAEIASQGVHARRRQLEQHNRHVLAKRHSSAGRSGSTMALQDGAHAQMPAEVGLQVHLNAALGGGNEVKLLKEVLPMPILELLRDRLDLIPEADRGANSFFIPFRADAAYGDSSDAVRGTGGGGATPTPHVGCTTSSIEAADRGGSLGRGRGGDRDTGSHLHSPRNAVEAAILDVIVPKLFGSMQGALDAGIQGAEWWVQTRGVSNPKEYHMDTAITWCRDNGWDPAMLPACHFYPSVASVFYLSDIGGATAVFNQTSWTTGMQPLVPSEVGLIRPVSNRMLLFKGNRYHGVMKTATAPLRQEDIGEATATGDGMCFGGDNSANKIPEGTPKGGNDGIRRTLLINYWGEDKTAGEKRTPTLLAAGEEEAFMDRLSGLVDEYYASLRQEQEQDPVGGTVGAGAAAGGFGDAPVYDCREASTHIAQEQPVRRVVMPTGYNFLQDLRYWQAQLIPPSYIEAAAAEGNNEESSRESILYTMETNQISVEMPKTGTVLHNWNTWLPRNHTREYLDAYKVALAKQYVQTQREIGNWTEASPGFNGYMGDEEEATDSSSTAIPPPTLEELGIDFDEHSVPLPEFHVDYAGYATMVSLGTVITPEEAAAGITAKSKLRDFRASLPGGDPFADVEGAY